MLDQGQRGVVVAGLQQQQAPTARLPLAIDQKAAADLDPLLAAVRHPALVGCDRLFELSSWPPKGFRLMNQRTPQPVVPACSSTPLLLGMAPARRGSISVAMRNALAKALKQASTMW